MKLACTQRPRDKSFAFGGELLENFLEMLAWERKSNMQSKCLGIRKSLSKIYRFICKAQAFYPTSFAPH